MKKFVLACIMMIGLMIGVDFAANPSLDIHPLSGSALKLHCNYDFNIKLNAGGKNYNAFDATIKFNSGEALIIHKTVNSPFVDNVAGFVVSGYLYRSYGALPGGQKSSSNVNATTWGFKTISNLTSTLLQFSSITGGTIAFGPATTDDGITINGYDVASADILTAVYDANYIFNPLPCIVDNNAPLFGNMVPINGSRFVASGQRASLLVYDRIGSSSIVGPAPLATNSTIHYRYSGLNTVLSNYQVSPANVDNQQGVNSGTIKLTVSCPTCNSFGGPYLLSGSDLNITLWTGDVMHNRYTWDSQDRGYTLWFDPPASYEIEKQVYITGVAVDNPNESGLVHTGTLNISFNAPQAPTIISIYPLAGATFVDTKNTLKLKFYFADDRAGIDTGTIQITIPAIMSGVDVLMTGYIYSGSDLEIILSGGSPGLGNGGDYLVQFYPKWDFPSNTGITITGFVLDLAGNTGTLNMTFITRPSCAFWGCNDIFQVIVMTGNYAGIFDFSGSLLVITGTDINSPYPYLTGENGDILMCGLPYSGTALNGNVNIYNTSDNVINGMFYTGTELYITGLNFIIQDGIIIIQ